MSSARFGFVYLASQSPRRRELLEQIGVRHEPLLASADEDAEALEAERPGEAPLAYVRRVTRAKLGAARLRLARRGGPEAPILCADTTVAIGRAILGKPRDAAEASEMLRRLADRTHRVITVVAVSVPRDPQVPRDPRELHHHRAAPLDEAGDPLREDFATSVSSVRFGAVGPDAIARYVASGEPFGKAGAYAIQGRAAAWIQRIAGSHSGIMGLPLYETAQLLKQAGVGF